MLSHTHNAFVRPSDLDGEVVTLTGEESRYVTKVIRLRSGDRLGLLAGEGLYASAEITGVSGSEVTTRVLAVKKEPRPAVSLTLVQAIPKGGRMDLIVEKATELGVNKIQPVETERVVKRLDAKRGAERAERWRRVSLSAARQSGNKWPPEIAEISAMERVMQSANDYDAVFVGSLRPGAKAIRETFREYGQNPPGNAAFIVGPEGDLTSDEMDQIVKAGGIEVAFGTAVLRVETAAVFALSVLSYEFRRDTSLNYAPKEGKNH